MSDLKLVKYPNDILTTKTKLVEKFDKDLHETVDKMANIMYDSEGAGIAANQVNLPYNIIIIDNQWFIEGEDKKPQVFINLEITDVYGDPIYWKEGCLSFDKIRPDVPRYEKIKVKYQDIEGKVIEESFEGGPLSMAHRLQHEYDHVCGKTFLNNLPRDKQIALLGEEGLALSDAEIDKQIERFNKINSQKQEWKVHKLFSENHSQAETSQELQR